VVQEKKPPVTFSSENPCLFVKFSLTLQRIGAANAAAMRRIVKDTEL